MNRNRKSMAKTGAVLLGAAMVVNTMAVPILAGTDAQKDENVYVNLNQDGSVFGVYVVNEYDLDEGTDITDYGNYNSVKNLTTDDQLKVSGDKVEIQAPAGKFYYQGNLKNAEVPWDISISYRLTEKKFQQMPLQEKEFTIKAQVKDFEMDAISFQAVPMSFDFDSSSMDMDELYDKTDEIKDVAKEFDDGASELKDGATKLKDGSSELKRRSR